MYCICCKKNNTYPVPTGKLGHTDKDVSEEDLLFERNRRPDGSLVNVNNQMIDNGIIHIVDAGYGSKFDGDQFIIAICDDCIKSNLEDSTLLYYGNYMVIDNSSANEEVKKSLKKYRRRKNLDGLV